MVATTGHYFCNNSLLYKMLDIGQRIKEVVERKGMSKSELSRRLNMSSTNIHKIFKRSSIDTGLLQRISAILEYDFFTQYTAGSMENTVLAQEPTGKYNTPATLISELQKEVALLRKENDFLKEINQLLREKMKLVDG